MIRRFHGIDRHKSYSTISVLNREGQEVDFIVRCTDLKEYIERLDAGDAVILEASSGSFYWADRIESTGAVCYVIDPHKFRIIKDSWNKSDKQDARNMVKSLWVHCVTGEFGIPAVYKPEAMIRELRKLFSQYQLLNRQIRVLKNNIQAVCTENGMNLGKEKKNKLFSIRCGKETVLELEVSNASVVIVQSCLELLWKVKEEKEKIRKEILVVGEPLKEAMKLLMTIKGIAPIVALAFLTDIGDVKRFKTLRQMNAYLGLVPKAKESGGKTKTGHINRESRKLTRTLLSQSIYHVADSSPYLQKYYLDLIERRGVGRARVAMMRKTCGVMRRMLLTGECYRWMDSEYFKKKLKRYEKELEKSKGEKKVA